MCNGEVTSGWWRPGSSGLAAVGGTWGHKGQLRVNYKLLLRGPVGALARLLRGTGILDRVYISMTSIGI